MNCLVFKSVRWVAVALLFQLPVSVVYAADDSVANSAEYHILAAEVAGQRGQAQIAASEYVKALRLAPTAELAERATQVAVYAEDAKLAFEAASQWVTFEPERLEPRVVLMRIAVALEQTDAAIEHALFIVDRHPKGPEQAFKDVAQALAHDKKHASAALDVMAGVSAEYGPSPDLDYAAALMALRLEEFAVAVGAVDRALIERDDWVEAYLLKASALLSLEKVAAATHTVNAADLGDEKQISLHLAFARLLLESELAEAAADQYRRVLELDDEHPEGLYAMGVLQINLENNEQAYRYFKVLHEQVTDQKDLAAYYLGGIEETRGNYESALEWYERVADGDRYLDAAQRKAFVLYKIGELEEARDWLARLRETQPDMAVQFYLAEGELLYEAGMFPKAMGLYNQGLEEFPGEIDLLYGRSLIAERMGHLTLSERDLRKILEMDPEDARSLNALGYILTNHTDRYEEALDLIERALEQTPDDAAVIDSMGWVQYHLGNLDEAHEYLTAAFEQMPDPEVAAHLGEVLWEMGRKDQAQAILKEALREAPDHPALRDTIKRLSQ